MRTCLCMWLYCSVSVVVGLALWGRDVCRLVGLEGVLLGFLLPGAVIALSGKSKMVRVCVVSVSAQRLHNFWLIRTKVW